MTKQEILDLIDECRKRGVSSIKTEDSTSRVEFSLYPEVFGSPGDPFAELSKPLDTTKCLQCQNAPPDGKLAGHCRVCSLKAAGAS
jgi:hypothetical protein